MAKNTGKVREKSGNFVSPEKWEPCEYKHQIWNEFYTDPVNHITFSWNHVLHFLYSRYLFIYLFIYTFIYLHFYICF